MDVFPMLLCISATPLVFLLVNLILNLILILEIEFSFALVLVILEI